MDNKKNRSYFFLTFLSVLLFAGMSLMCCSSSNQAPTEEMELIKSFTVWMDNERNEAIVDNENRQILIDGIKNGNNITHVEYVLNEGVSIYPNPNYFLTKWENEQRVVITYNNCSYTYSILLEASEEVVSNDLVIQLTNPKQKITLLGGDMERSQNFLPKAANPSEIANWCFKDINFDVCRVSYDKKQELEAGKKNLAFYNDAVKSMKLLREANPSIEFWATMKSDYNGYNNENNLPDWICDYKPTTFFDCEKYAVFLADYLEHMQQKGVAIKYLSTAKEWVSVVTAERARDVIIHLNKECSARGIEKPLYVDPASWGITQGANFVKKTNEIGSLDLYHAFSTHNLNDSESDNFLYEVFVDEVNKHQKYAFADETSVGSGGRTNGEEPETLQALLDSYRERTEFYKDGIQGELFFEIFSRNVSSESRSVYFIRDGEAKRMRSYYVMQSFTNGISRKNMHYIPTVISENHSEIYSMAFANDKELFLGLINKGDVGVNGFSISWNELFQGKKAEMIMHHISHPIEGTQQDITTLGNRIKVDLLPESIVFIRVEL